MFRDHSLVPAEAIRLAALGFLAEGPQPYSELARAVRDLAGVVTDPSTELMGTPLELLRYEKLVEANTAADPELRITAAGREALGALLRARLRAPTTDLGRLGLTLKLRFLHHLPPAEQADQLSLVIAACESGLARTEGLRTRHGETAGLLGEWLDHDIDHAKACIALLRERRNTLTAARPAVPEDGTRSFAND
jgi:hypothetical protein